jgi:hypothetical protein
MVAVDGVEAFSLYFAGFHWGMAATALVAGISGIATGLLHGHEEYSPFW